MKSYLLNRSEKNSRKKDAFSHWYIFQLTNYKSPDNEENIKAEKL